MAGQGQACADMSKLKIVYIAGYGRSGSTMLDMSLHQHPDIFGAGEIAEMCRHVWTENEYCACKRQIRSCELWSSIMADWARNGGDVGRYFQMQKRIEPLLSMDRLRRTETLRWFNDMTAAMFEAIAANTGTSIIVDSSKAPGRGLAHALNGAIDLRVVHNVRDARAVANSMTKSMDIDVEKGVQKKIKSRSPYRTAIRWRMYNSYVEALIRNVGAENTVRVRYEDFSTQSKTELQRIGACIGVDLSDVGDAIEAERPIVAGHQMAGSRIRMKGELVMRLDAKWKETMTALAQKQVLSGTSAQMKRYGYIA